MTCIVAYKCNYCRFFKSTGIRGECRCNEPKINAEGKSVWPKTEFNDWCGKYEKRKKKWK